MLSSKSIETTDYPKMPEGVAAAVHAAFWLAGQGVDVNIPHENRVWEYATAIQAFHGKFADNNPADRYVIDVGSGMSPLSFALASRYGCSVTDIDPSPRVAAWRNSLYACLWRHRPKLAQLMSFHGCGLADANDTYDAVMCMSVLEHLPTSEQEQAWRKLASLVAPDGILIASVDFCVDDSAHANDEAREHRFTPANISDIKRWLEMEGLQVSDFDTIYHGDMVWNYTFFRILAERPA